MTKIFYLWNEEKQEIYKNLIFKTDSETRNEIVDFCWKTVEKEVDYKCVCDNYQQTTFILIHHLEDGEITIVGTDTYCGLFHKLGLPIDVDIEKQYPGYEMMTIDYFSRHFKVSAL
jgi:hypothetical protein